MNGDDRMLLAAELVLGLLDNAERSQALELLALDADFAQEVRRWEAHLAPLFAGFAAREPSRDLYPDIRERLDRIEQGRGSYLSQAQPVPLAANENDGSGVAPGWRLAAIGSAAAAAVLAAVLVLTPTPSQPGDLAQNDAPAALPEPTPAPARRMVVAQLSGDEGGPQFVASRREGDAVLRVRITHNLDEAPGTVPVLWVIAGDNPPEAVSTLGDASAGQAQSVSRIALKQALLDMIDSGATLAVTFEPAGAASYDAPTTPIVAKGTVSEL